MMSYPPLVHSLMSRGQQSSRDDYRNHPCNGISGLRTRTRETRPEPRGGRTRAARPLSRAGSLAPRGASLIRLPLAEPRAGCPSAWKAGTVPTTMALWKLAPDGSAVPVPEERLVAEAMIESAVESAPELLGIEALIIGRQIPTPSGPLDLLVIDSDGRLIVVENKRDRTPRDVLAQTIDYASYIATLTLDDVATLFASYVARRGDMPTDLSAAFEERFGVPLDIVDDVPRMLIVASRLDESTERMIAFLRERFSVPVNAALFQPFSGGLIGRTWLRPDVVLATRNRSAATTTQSRDESKLFWDAWLPIGRPVLDDVRLPQNGPRAVWISRRLIPGIPASLTLWVSSSEAYAEVQFDDERAALNEALLEELKREEAAIEESFGGHLEWRGPEPGSLMTRRTKITTTKVQIGQRTNPTDQGLRDLADTARRLVDAVKPRLSAAYDRAAVSDVELDEANGELGGASDGDSSDT